MGLFNFGKKKKLLELQSLVNNRPIKNSLFLSEQELYECARTIANNDLKVIGECIDLINNTKNPDVFFKRYDILFERLNHLIRFEKYLQFPGVPIEIRKKNIIESRSKSIQNFLKRYYQEICRKSFTYKQAGTIYAHLGEFKASLMEYYPRMNADHIAYIDKRFPNHNVTAAFFESGNLVKTLPKGKDSSDTYSAKYINSDGVFYDIENADDINALPIPDFAQYTNQGVTGTLDYILRMKASQIRRSGNHELSLILLMKTTELMEKSKTLWTLSDYQRLVTWLNEDGFPDEADRYNKMFREKYSREKFNEQVHSINLQNAKTLETDLVEADYFGGCCGECAKYRGRWFSISGKSKIFPKMPENYGCTCPGLTFFPVMPGISEPTYCPPDVDIIAYSNRPFIDDRTPEEIETYEKHRAVQVAEEEFEKYKARWDMYKGRNEREYNKLMEICPDKAPKNFSSYLRMKNSNSTGYKKLIEIALANGLDIRYTDEERQEVDFIYSKKRALNKANADLNNYLYKKEDDTK